MKERQEILSRTSSVEESIKKCANSLENLINYINDEFCLSLDKIKKRERRLKKSII